jgi:gliding motility associated protien GldN
MKKINAFLIVLLVTIVINNFYGQTVKDRPKYPDTPYIKENIRTRKPIPYTALREADVMWSKRVWRVIDLREKMNFPLYYPEEALADRKSLFDVFKDAAIKSGDGFSITCFDNPLFDDEFRFDMTPSDVIAKLSSWDTVLIQDAIDPEKYTRTPVNTPITCTNVWKYWVKEDWFYDKERSVMEVRIMGICPLIEKITQDGQHLGADKPLFWIYFPEARPLLATQEVFMRHNDAERKSFDDIFWKRMFSSYVRKESNVYNRGIYDYKNGLDQLLEAERVKNDIFTYEHDLWHF